MKTNSILVLVLCLLMTNISLSQDPSSNVFDFSIDLGLSNDLSQSSSYPTSNFFSQIEIDKKNITFVRNITFSYSRFINEEHGFELVFGNTSFGFDFEGEFSNTNDFYKDSFVSTYLEWGASYINRILLSNSSSILIKPGIRYHSDASSSSRTINFYDKDAFSLSIYLGYEVPIYRDKIFINIGLQSKIPLSGYSSVFTDEPEFFPYFAGLKIGVNYQF